MLSLNELHYSKVVELCLGHFVQVMYMYISSTWLVEFSCCKLFMNTENFQSEIPDQLITTIWSWSFPHSEYGLWALALKWQNTVNPSIERRHLFAALAISHHCFLESRHSISQQLRPEIIPHHDLFFLITYIPRRTRVNTETVRT
jgi:hypothetical protein